MGKKLSNKKKINLRLSVGDTAIVITYDLAMHIAETYDYLATEHQDEHSDSFNIKACKNCGMLAEFNPNPNYSVY